MKSSALIKTKNKKARLAMKMLWANTNDYLRMRDQAAKDGAWVRVSWLHGIAIGFLNAQGVLRHVFEHQRQRKRRSHERR